MFPFLPRKIFIRMKIGAEISLSSFQLPPPLKELDNYRLPYLFLEKQLPGGRIRGDDRDQQCARGGEPGLLPGQDRHDLLGLTRVQQDPVSKTPPKIFYLVESE